MHQQTERTRAVSGKLKKINNMKNLTATQLADICYTENQPIDWGWIKYINRNSSSEEKLDWARGCIEPFADGCSKNKITRAAQILLSYLNI